MEFSEKEIVIKLTLKSKVPTEVVEQMDEVGEAHVLNAITESLVDFLVESGYVDGFDVEGYTELVGDGDK